MGRVPVRIRDGYADGFSVGAGLWSLPRLDLSAANSVFSVSLDAVLEVPPFAKEVQRVLVTPTLPPKGIPQPSDSEVKKRNCLAKCHSIQWFVP